MVAAEDIGMDIRSDDRGAQGIAHQKVVDTPPRIVLSGIEAIAPPRIRPLKPRVKHAEGVHEARREQIGKLAALLIGKACIAAVGFRVLQVDFLVRHIEIAAHHNGFWLRRFTRARQRKFRHAHMVLARGLGLHGNARRNFARFEPLAKPSKRIVPRHAMVDARKAVLGIGGIHIDQPKFGEFQRHDAPLCIELARAEAMQSPQRCLPRKDRRTRIALAFGIAPILRIPRQINVDLSLLKLGFLQADDICRQTGDRILEAFFHRGPQAIDIPRNETHRAHSLAILGKTPFSTYATVLEQLSSTQAQPLTDAENGRNRHNSKTENQRSEEGFMPISTNRHMVALAAAFSLTLFNSTAMLLSAGGSLFGTLANFGKSDMFNAFAFPSLAALLVTGAVIGLRGVWNLPPLNRKLHAAMIAAAFAGAAFFIGMLACPSEAALACAIAAGPCCAIAYLLQFMAWSRHLAERGFKDALCTISLSGAIAAIVALALFAFSNALVMASGFCFTLIAGSIAAYLAIRPLVAEDSEAKDDSEGDADQKTRTLWPLFVGCLICVFTMLLMWQGEDDAIARSSSAFITRGTLAGFIACSLCICGIAAMHPAEDELRRAITTLCPLFAALPIVPCIVAFDPDELLGVAYGVLTGVGFSYFMAAPIASFCCTAANGDTRKVWGIAAITLAIGGTFGRLAAMALPPSGTTALTLAMFLAYLVALALIPRGRAMNREEGPLPSQAANPLDARCESLSRSWQLTPRESEVLPLLARGHTQPAIAKELFCSPETIKVHVRHIYEKAGVHSRDELIEVVNEIHPK